MLKLLLPAGLASVLFLNAVTLPTTPPTEAARKNYTTYCSSCHGEKVEAFVDRRWKHGIAKADLVKSITHGYPDLGLPAWGPSLKPQEIDDLADLILVSMETLDQYKFASKPKSNTFSSEGMTIRLDTVAAGLESPWGLVFLPGGDMVVSDRAGSIYRLNATGKKTKLTGVPEVVAEGQGGMLDLELHPDFAKNNILYISYSAGKTENGQKLSTTALMRARLTETGLADQKVIFEAQPWSRTRHHYGGRIEFDRKGFLYLSVGDRGAEKVNPQSLESDCGKVHRMKDDGTAPTDNPFIGKAGARPTIFSWGHRNPQGIAIFPGTGELWAHEHGPRGGDELNIVRKGKNYGWPVISYGINYDGTTFTNLTAKEGMEQPETYWIPSIGPSGMAFVTSDKYPGWKGNLMMGSLRFQYLNRCVLKNGKVVKQENLLPNLGRMRDVRLGPDGYLYVSVENPGYIFRLMPSAM